MSAWIPYAIVAALLYGLHQVFTKLAADRIGEGLGGFIVEATATATIVVYLLYLRLAHQWNQASSAPGIWWSAATGFCVGIGTIAFFLLFQRGGPLSAVPGIVAGGAAFTAVVGFLAFHEPMPISRIAGVLLSVLGLYLLRK